TSVRVEHVFVIACILIPGFELRAALRERPHLQLEPAALAPLPGSDQVVGPVTAAAVAAGVRPGMRLGEALAMCPPLLPIEQDRREELEGLGVRTLGELARLPGSAVAERLGPVGRNAWSLSRGGARGRVHARRPPAEIVERIEFPEAVGNELTLRRSLGALVDRALGRPERASRAVRKVAVAARLVGGGSWRRTVTLREPTGDRARLRTVLASRLTELPAPAVALALELVELAEWVGQ